ncbi:hypothetical protein [Oceanicola sp. S124]|uniref:hypothetical protein n=1 Tax=Oceanicola sp. S124 TaxID=1042378 RepID=UPI00025590B7|nr:hypothetical protein [Oceanicola sp. S124]
MGSFDLLHRQSDRRATYATLQGLTWSDELSAWVSADPEAIRAALRAPEIEVIDFRSVYATLSERFSIDFRPTVQVLDHVALGLNGQPHHEVRRRQTLYLKSVTEAALAAYGDSLAAQLAAHADSGSFCLARDLAFPAVDAMFGVLSGFRLDDRGGTSFSSIFDRRLGLNRRKAINEGIARLIAGTEDPVALEGVLTRISLSVVGADSLYGSLTQSLRQVLDSHPGRPLARIDWPAEIPATAVPYVDRIARQTVTIAGTRIAAGERVRLYVEALKSGPDGPSAGLFGIGAHVCLGKHLSIKAWQMMVAALRSHPGTLTVTEHRFRPNDYLFNADDALIVAVS